MRRGYAVTRRRTAWLLAAVDALGAALWRIKPAPLHPLGPVRELLLIRLERGGDVVTLLPAIARARALFPGVRITWMARSAYRDFIRAAAVVDEVWGVASLAAGLRAGLGAALRSRRRRFDLAVDFHADGRCLLLGRLWARRLAGHGIRGGGFLLDVAAPYPWALDVATRHVRLIEAAAGAAPAAPARPRLRLAPEWAAEAALRVGDWAGFVILHPGSGQPSKRWPRVRWRQLLDRCVERGFPAALTGSAAEGELCRWLAATGSAGGADIRSLAGLTGWGGLAGLVARAAAVVAPDTGIIHLAQALGTPSVALFGPNDPAVWGYDDDRHRSLARPLECSYCARGRCPRPEAAAGAISPCMAAITVEDAWRGLEAVMARPGRAKESPPAPRRHGLPA